VAQIQIEPPLAGVQMQNSVPLSAGGCSDYRSSLKADFVDASRIRFLGSYPASCGEKVWPVAYADPKSYAVRAVEGMWREMGGKIIGTVREGRLPATTGAAGAVLKPAFEVSSPMLPEVIRDINKYSNNVMAQQLFLSLSLQNKMTALGANVAAGAASASNAAGPGGLNQAATLAASREVVQRWWRSNISEADVPVLDNGSGLSRSERISANALVKLLQYAYAAPTMPELMSSLPISGLDGTMRSSRSKARGSAHLKTGTLSNASAIAGYVLANSGKRYVVVMVVNQTGAAAARPAMDALLDWVMKD
jgi:serine-type D-Ala-D-Ala carboxypeptidase/endopeptidase (penicillin-binding protein 4)